MIYGDFTTICDKANILISHNIVYTHSNNAGHVQWCGGKISESWCQ